MRSGRDRTARMHPGPRYGASADEAFGRIRGITRGVPPERDRVAVRDRSGPRLSRPHCAAW
ncbi:hypothetical protein METUNv1_02169 [Methyloversatilis universalis FAM5]|uniref:Uncharacterized protein n=1 Tax=Methyloversatilis universalis (strain ATCC BAA-1314 / DSM 25237 / JCM 13912 / CCUG 52030 / FAM5) TaxID=1000565 RepID=F5RD12_METUF|nr:hypothetical protein METUNv1_02169 [Methyloversatilis universalis FAM5]